MLEKYKKYINLEILNEEVIKPDPPGVSKLHDTKSYYKEFNEMMNEALAKVKKEASEKMAEKLKRDWGGKIISFQDENGRQKIIEITDVIVENKGVDHYPVLVEDKDRKFRFYWENEGRSKIYDVGKFLDFFEEHYLDNLIMFQGKHLKGGGEPHRMIKQPIKVGIHNGSSQDFIILECDDKTSVLLMHTQPIKIMDARVKELDPYGEENWDK